MKKTLCALALSLILASQSALAGLPPTTSKGSGDSSDITTFKYQFPNFAVTHTGTTVSLGILGTAGGGTGNSTGTATNVTTTSVSSNASFFPLMAPSSTNGSQATDLDSLFFLNPSTGTLNLSISGQDNYQLIANASGFAMNDSSHASDQFFTFRSNTAYLCMGVGTCSNDWYFAIPSASSNTTPLTDLIPNTSLAPILNLRNSSATSNNWGSVVFSGSTDKMTSAIVGVNDLHTAGSETGHLEFEVNNAGTKATAMKINAAGTITLPQYITAGAIVNDGSGNLTSVAPSTSGNLLTSNGTAWVSSASPAGIFRNYFLNSRLRFWQRGTSVTIANAATAYEADRAYVKNSLGTNGVITYSQVAAVSDGASFGASVKITTAPTAAQVNGTEFYQVLENADSLALYNKTASFGAKIKALGNVNQVGLQFCYATSEAKCASFIGSEATCTVSSGSFTSCADSGQALGTAMTTAGSIGVRIRITTVSSGNTYDLNNGFVVELPQINLATALGPYQSAEPTVASELAACERYYEKSYDIDTAPGSVTNIGEVLIVPAGSRPNTANWGGDTRFKVEKRSAASTMRLYCPDGASGGTGNSGCALANSVTDTTSGILYLNSSSFMGTNNSGGAAGSLNGSIEFQWTADDDI